MPGPGRLGSRYIVPTAKHHDGFAMWETAAVGDPSAVGEPGSEVYGVGGPGSATDRDLFGEIASAATQHGMVLGAYFSKADWHASSFWVKPSTNPGTDYFPKYTGPNFNFSDGEEGPQDSRSSRTSRRSSSTKSLPSTNRS
eukprot:TRINITY_DN12295_c0_g1_i2.p1 TRINITY_DN12295_c0_g1~~TRINITY_DN12295_c0_g1_i2.p1  ORF type:complete len:141 (+),score=14.25 TRINITY_DN12295_c0_g1_i2:285-707(+)